jgi:imidazole glycerol-phosphate synthase subunit HisH
MITLINYGSGNIHAIANIYKRLNIPYILASEITTLKKAEKLILPGVGDFDETMKLFRKLGIKDTLDELVLVKKVPILGVCVGMQVLGKSSDEGSEDGFGWIDGEVKKFDVSKFIHKPHLPHMGWNEVGPVRKSSLFDQVIPENGFYFLHSYYFSCKNETDILAKTKYGIDFASAINHNNVYGFQFHPEKSHQNGIEIFKNYANL